MSSADVEILINEEIKDKLATTNLYGVNLPECLIRPILENYVSSIDSSKILRAWTVLIEGRKRRRIFYEEDENIFGVGLKSNSGELFYLATYGTFLQTLEAM